MSSKLKRITKGIVLLISIYFPPEFGGGSTGAWNRAMTLHKMGYSVFVLCGFPSLPSGKASNQNHAGKYFLVERMEPFVVIRLKVLPLKHRGFLRRLIVWSHFVMLTIIYIPRILKITGKLDVVYSRAPIVFSSFSGYVYSKLTGCYFVFEAPDLFPEQLVVINSPLSFLIMKIGGFIAKISYSVPDVILTVSNMAAEHISKTYRPKVPVYGIPIGVDPRQFPRFDKIASRNNLIDKKIFPNELANKFVILYAGSISSQQRIENLVYAADKLRTNDSIAFVIIGDGDDREKIEHLKTSHALDNFYLLSPQPRTLMPEIIAAADVCAILLSSEPIFDIALPTKFYEFLASGKPLIGMCSGELANIIASNNIGRTLRLGDFNTLASLVVELNNSPESLRRLENNCLLTVQKFSLDQIATELSEIFEKERSE